MKNISVFTYYVRIPQNEIESYHLMKIRGILDLEELSMLDKYKGQRKVQFAYSRYLTKYQLSKLINIPVSEVKFKKSRTGKLFLLPSICKGIKNMYEFSISHSDNICACSISETSAVGVDIEKITKYKRLNIMYKVFNEREQQHVNSQLNQYNKLKEFYRIWTRKEAFFKAFNDGNSITHLKDIIIPLQSMTSYKYDWICKSHVIEDNFMLSTVVKKNVGNIIGNVSKVDINNII